MIMAALSAKGFGDLPDSLSLLRPLALMGDVSWETPLGDGRPVNELGYHAALTYHLRALHEIVNFPSFLEPLSLVTEFNFETVVNGDEQGETESFVTSGVVYSTDRRQVGVAFQLPLREDGVDLSSSRRWPSFTTKSSPRRKRTFFPEIIASPAALDRLSSAWRALMA